MEQHAATEPLTVSAAMALAKGALESITVTLVGEVSEVSNKPGYKAVYFSVKDENASMPCMMWMNKYHQTGVDLTVGQLVQMTGRFTLYAPKGRMNFDVFTLALAGEGDLRARVARIARTLQAEGLMDASRKRPLPDAPQSIGLVTSPRGAAVHDVLRTLRRRYPLARVLLAGVPVEGAGAAQGIAEGMRIVAEAGAQVVLLVRGGGSFEDLMPFNDEALARSIAQCPVPVVTGIGHEPDTSIADMVADVRASTPTAAAETVAPDVREMRAALSAREASMVRALEAKLQAHEMALDRYATRPLFCDPMQLFALPAQTIDMLSERLYRAIPAALSRDTDHVDHMERALMRTSSTLLDRFDNELALRAARLDDLSPLAVIGRGYSLTRDAQGKLVRSITQVKHGDAVEVLLGDGSLHCEVISSES